MEQVSLQAWSAVWRVFTDAGPVLLKQTTAVRACEGATQTILADLAPDFVDRPLATSIETGRTLLEDLGSTMFEASPENRGIEVEPVSQMLTDYARLQHATLDERTSVVGRGLSVWDPALAFEDAERQAHDLHALPADDPRAVTTEQRDQILNARHVIEEAAAVVAGSPVPMCLEHGDLWPGNVIPPRGGARHYRFIDFGDAVWSHPFLSLIMLIIECRFRWSVSDDAGALNIGHPAITTIADAYLQQWSDYAALAELRKTLEAALRLAALRRSRAWIDNLARADESQLRRHGDMPWSWLHDVVVSHPGSEHRPAARRRSRRLDP